MSWAIYDYNRTGVLVSPELAWNVENGEPTEVLSAPGQGFFSPINQVLLWNDKVEGISGDFWEGLNQATITVTANEIPNEAIPKTISVTYIDRNGVERPERRTKHTVGPRPGIGFNFLSQLFQTSTKTHGVTAIEVTVTSGNLFSSGAIPIFKQRYSIDELRMMNNSGLVIGSSTFVGRSTVEDLYVERFEPEQDTETTQYIVKPGEGYSEPQEEDKEDTAVDTVFNAPPPRNKSHRLEGNRLQEEAHAYWLIIYRGRRITLSHWIASRRFTVNGFLGWPWTKRLCAIPMRFSSMMSSARTWEISSSIQTEHRLNQTEMKTSSTT